MIGSAIDSECTTDRAGVGESDAPFAGANRVTRHAPLLPPRNTVNMLTWKRGTGGDTSGLCHSGARAARARNLSSRPDSGVVPGGMPRNNDGGVGSSPLLRLGLLLHIRPQHRIDAPLVAAAFLLEEVEHVFIDANGDRLLLGR